LFILPVAPGAVIWYQNKIFAMQKEPAWKK